MDFLQQKQRIAISDLRIGNIIYYGLVQWHIITGINHSENSIKIRPEEYYYSGRVNQSKTLLSTDAFNKDEIIVPVTKINSSAIILNKLNDYGFTWIDPYSVFYLIENDKFIVECVNVQYADIKFENAEFKINKRVYTFHELQNIFKLASGVDFVDINKF